MGVRDALARSFVRTVRRPRFCRFDSWRVGGAAPDPLVGHLAGQCSLQLDRLLVFTSKSQGAWNPQKLVLMPRVGVAIRINDRTALRFGYARYVIPSELNIQGAPYAGYQNLTFIQ